MIMHIRRWKWLDSRRLTNICERWSKDHTDALQYALFNGDGFESWENVWGTWNGYALLRCNCNDYTHKHTQRARVRAHSTFFCLGKELSVTNLLCLSNLFFLSSMHLFFPNRITPRDGEQIRRVGALLRFLGGRGYLQSQDWVPHSINGVRARLPGLPSRYKYVVTSEVLLLLFLMKIIYT